MTRRNTFETVPDQRESKSFDFTPILEPLIPEINVVHSPSMFAEMYREHIRNGGDSDVF